MHSSNRAAPSYSARATSAKRSSSCWSATAGRSPASRARRRRSGHHRRRRAGAASRCHRPEERARRDRTERRGARRDRSGRQRRLGLRRQAQRPVRRRADGRGRRRAFDAWAAAPARAAFTFLSGAAGYLVEQDRRATLIQVTGGSARRAMPGRGPVGGRRLRRARDHAGRRAGAAPAGHPRRAADRRRGHRTAQRRRAPGTSPEALADPRALAEAVLFLAEQGPRAATHELQVTPLAETWMP